MPSRQLPVRPNLQALEGEAGELLRRFRAGESSARDDFDSYHRGPVDPANAGIDDAQLVLARSYEAADWPRLVQSCELIDAIWKDDLGMVRSMIQTHPNLLTENAGVRNNNWGPPMSYAANLGRDAIVTALHDMGAPDGYHAMGRATLQGKIGTARLINQWLGSPRPTADDLGGPAYTLSVSGTEFLFELGAQVLDQNGNPHAPVDVVLETDSRRPQDKHAILRMYAEHGYPFPDTPTMALHRGRIDLLEAHLNRDPELLRRTFSYQEIFPPEIGCHAEALPRTTLAGATLLHIAVEFDEIEIAAWLLDHGMSADAPAAIDSDGFGGHTALFAAVVCFANFWGNYRGQSSDPSFARLLLERGANPNARASLREVGGEGANRTVREHYNLTPLAWGQRFHYELVVNREAMRLIRERGGIE